MLLDTLRFFDDFRKRSKELKLIEIFRHYLEKSNSTCKLKFHQFDQIEIPRIEKKKVKKQRTSRSSRNRKKKREKKFPNNYRKLLFVTRLSQSTANDRQVQWGRKFPRELHLPVKWLLTLKATLLISSLSLLADLMPAATRLCIELTPVADRQCRWSAPDAESAGFFPFTAVLLRARVSREKVKKKRKRKRKNVGRHISGNSAAIHQPSKYTDVYAVYFRKQSRYQCPTRLRVFPFYSLITYQCCPALKKRYLAATDSGSDACGSWSLAWHDSLFPTSEMKFQRNLIRNFANC